MATTANKLKDIVSGNVCLNIIYRKAEVDEGYIAECIELPGCMAQGDTKDEAKINIVEAIEACISVLLEDAINANIGNREEDLSAVEKTEKIYLDPHVKEACA